MQVPKIKDKNIRIFWEDVDGDESIKHYIHPRNSFLKAYVIQLSANEQASADAIQDRSDIEFIVNYREIIVDMYVEFNNKTYRISGIDYYEFYITEVKFRAYEVNVKQYDKVRWAE